MKNKVFNIVLGVLLIISIAGNIFLLKSASDTQGEVAAFSSRLVIADNQIADLQEQLTDFEEIQEQVADLQDRIAQSKEQIEALETSISESNTQIDSLESAIEENNITIENLQEQLATAQKNNQQQTAQQQSSQGSGTGNSGNSGGGSTTQQPQIPEPGTVMPGGIIWQGGGGELPSAGSEYSGIEWE